MAERRYHDDEVRKIFALATSRKVTDPPASSAADGLTLADVQSIGREVGIEPDVVARAAASLDALPARAARKSWGMPIEVGRIVPLPRTLTDREWEQLVAELRTTFRAKGKVTAHGSLREWWNGNLHACVEPTDTGYRLRLGTLKGDAAGINALGATGILASALVSATLAVSGGLQEALLAPWILGMFGIGAFAVNVIRLPRWAKQREQQMEHIAARIRAIMETNPKPDAD